MATNFFSPLSFVVVFGSGIRDPGSGMGKNQDPGSGINIPDPQHYFLASFIFIIQYSKLIDRYGTVFYSYLESYCILAKFKKD
jgi:hypothetical protein